MRVFLFASGERLSNLPSHLLACAMLQLLFVALIGLLFVGLARIKQDPFTSTRNPAFVADYLSREHVLPGGAHLDPAEWTDGEVVPAGTLVGRTYAERDAETGFGPVAVDGTSGEVTDDEVYLTAYDVIDPSINADVDLLRHGTLIKENRLPGWADLTAEVQAWIRDNYQTTVGTA